MLSKSTFDRGCGARPKAVPVAIMTSATLPGGSMGGLRRKYPARLGYARPLANLKGRMVAGCE